MYVPDLDSAWEFEVLFDAGLSVVLLLIQIALSAVFFFVN